MLLPKRSVTLIIQLTVHKAKLAKQLPHCLVVPIKDREYTHERGPPLTAWLYFFQILGPRIRAPIAHDYCFDTLVIDQFLDLSLEVTRIQLDLDSIPDKDFSRKRLAYIS